MGEAQTSHPKTYGPEIFEIRIHGHLHKSSQELFEGLTITQLRDGTTVFYGSLPDQTALHSILLRIRNKNLKLISVNQIAPEDTDLQKDRSHQQLTEEFVARFPWFIDEALIKGNLDAWNELFHPEFSECAGSKGVVIGIQACKDRFMRLRSSISKHRYTIKEIIAQGDSVVVCTTTEIVPHEGETSDPEAVRSAKISGCAIFHLRAGKAFEAFTFGDWLGSSQQANMIPPSGKGAESLYQGEN